MHSIHSSSSSNCPFDSPQTYTTSSLGNQHHNHIQNSNNNVTQLTAVSEVEYDRNSVSSYHENNKDIHNTYKYGLFLSNS